MFQTMSNEISMIGAKAHKFRTYGLPAILTVADAARFLKMNINTVYQAIDAGTMPGRKMGGRIIILRDALLNHLRGEGG